MTSIRIALLAVLFSVFGASLAAAADTTPAPANDERTTPQRLSLPVSVSGTTVGATRDPNEPSSGCGNGNGPSVWYAFDATAKKVTIALEAAGDLDASVELFSSRRSQLGSVDCEETDTDGEAVLNASVKPGTRYLIRVVQRSNSVAGTFKLQAFTSTPAPAFPGTRLKHGHHSGSVDSLGRPEDAYAMRLRVGVTYKVNLSTPGRDCVDAEILDPGASSYDSMGWGRISCGGYTLITPGPGQGGTWSFYLTPRRARAGVQRYRLAVGRAHTIDTAPGVALANRQVVRGSLNGRALSVRHLYRFDVKERSDVVVKLAAASDDIRLSFRSTRGNVVQAEDHDTVRLRRGHYYVVVSVPSGERGSRYRLQLQARAVTRTTISLDRTATPGSSTPIAVNVAGGHGGVVSLQIERFDPVDGWQFLRHVTAPIGSVGRVSVPFRAPSVGSYRVSARYLGSATSARSRSGRYAHLTVASPI